MHKVFITSALALVITGCAAQQGGGPQVRDLSEASRAVQRSSSGYTVKPGDTLYGIAWQHNLDYRQLAALNSIDPPYQIHPGDQLQLGGNGGQPSRPSTEMGQSDATVTTQSRSAGAVATGLNQGGGQPVASVSQAQDQELDWLLPDETAIERDKRQADEREPESATEAEPQAETASESQVASINESEPVAEAKPEPAPEPETVSEAPTEPDVQDSEPQAAPPTPRAERTYTPVETVDWQWPVDGQVVGGFGKGSNVTAGIDIAGEKGQSVKAAGPGIVVYAGSGVRGYGNLVLLKHNDQYLSAYAHNDSLLVDENDVVAAGDVIATMGDSDAEDVRLHFEVREDGQPKDPLTFLPSR
ncbi:peptidoglycan DD-metalloendopeptidase family protein [Halomonas sp. ZH2S]|uniref:Peptidoglycan DD-metalloendopeptidase family protein n=1 Tax=Vreelandella zhuhanensis TaxID=2684210 RepID=A0A7X3KRW7_9GAMM|nr:peptidoglycan DD-metalloendopeptidase family protein [Halomonas zhuhanensis]MWJ29248.1 peptidoglycan DD-metalloendopeptidase family protein [Halomonas zhuhanensis]